MPLFLFFLPCFTGLGFRPLPSEDNVESTLIWYKGTDEKNYKMWTDALDDFLQGKNHGDRYRCYFSPAPAAITRDDGLGSYTLAWYFAAEKTQRTN